MCGISGAYRRPALTGRHPHAEMRDALGHRGPDDRGLHIARTPDGRPYAALGSTRLSIIDIEGGHQPVSSPDERIWVSLNGEIYNHATLRRKEGARGLKPKNGSDTALLAALLATLPLDNVLKSLQGMFAFATLDTKTGTLSLVRDRMGVKPLYWTQLPDGTLLWSSELKGLLTHPAVPRVLDHAALRQYLMFEYVPSPRTIYKDIFKLPPGCVLETDGTTPRIRRWWVPPGVRGADAGGSLSRWAQSVGRALRVAVHSRMEADVPVGYLLSGGLDSASVTAAARQRDPKSPLHTFSMAVEAPGFDESGRARATAEALGATHHEARLTPDIFLETADEIWSMLDEPLADSSLVATWALMAAVKAAGFKCVQSGDGADESFGGYPTYFAHQLARPASLFQGPLRQLARRLPVRHEGVTAGYMARRFVAGLPMPWPQRHQVWMGAWLPEEVGAEASDWAEVEQHSRDAEQGPASDVVSRAMYLDQRLYLSEGVLVKVDRASMASGVEVRSPFLDYRLVELAADIPAQMKVRGRQNKLVLRKAVADWLPAQTVSAPKKGFGSPVGPWLRGSCRHLLDGLPEQLDDLIDPKLLRTCITEHTSGTADHRRRLWSAVVLARWRVGEWGPG
ncbi:MAG: asparagine synthase (glutamine-hydrolyzing) [Myxococcota bacterium]